LRSILKELKAALNAANCLVAKSSVISADYSNLRAAMLSSPLNGYCCSLVVCTAQLGHLCSLYGDLAPSKRSDSSPLFKDFD
jgi:hypothetical protein